MDVVCFVPGILGSELVTADGLTVWPPTAQEGITQLAHEKIDALLAPDDLVSVGAVETVCIKKIYGPILETIEDAGFHRLDGDKRLVVLHYDWRLDIVDEIAPRLADALDDIAANGAKRIHFVAHSMGGLLARVLLQDPQYATRPWRPLIRHLITIATPYRGAPQALARMVGLEGTSGIPAWAFAQLRKVERLRAPYQLLPPREVPILWLVAGGDVQHEDLFAQGGWGEQNGFHRKSLDAVAQLHRILAGPLPESVSAFQFAGTGFATVTRLAWDPNVRAIMDDNAGDETVPLSSACHTNAPTMILPGDHVGICQNARLLRTLKALLGGHDGYVIFNTYAGGSRLPRAAAPIQLSLPAEGVVQGSDFVQAMAIADVESDEDRAIIVRAYQVDPAGMQIGELVSETRAILPARMADLRFQLPVPQAVGYYQYQLDVEGAVTDEESLIVREFA